MDRHLDLETNRNGSRPEGERTVCLLPGGLATNRLGQSVTTACDLATCYQDLIIDAGGRGSVEPRSAFGAGRGATGVYPQSALAVRRLDARVHG